MITRQVDSGVAVVTIHRPEVLNALDAATLLELDCAIHDLDGDPEVNVLIITGAGERAFCAGGDLRDYQGQASVADALALPMSRVYESIARTRVPTIAAVNGVAFGGGFELALACDLRVASHKAVFALPELRWSMLPAAGGITRLTRLVGASRAMQMILLSQQIDARTAADLGLCIALEEGVDALTGARDVADVILQQGPLAVALARQTVRVAADADIATALSAERLALAALYPSRDRKEGIDAFRERRTPRFSGE